MPRIAALLLALTVTPLHAATYHIGNSLTWDSIGGGNGLADIAEASGSDYLGGHHIMCSKALNYIWANPSQTCVAPHETFGNFNVALPGYEWDQVTLQPHLGSTIGAEAAAIKQFVDLTRSNPANAQTAFYITGTWPKTTDGAYSEVWLRPSNGLPSEPVLQRRAFFDNLYSQADALTDATLRYIPTGEVFYRLGELAAAGEFPGVSSLNAFYRDTQHLSSLGSYVAIASMFSTLEKRNPHTIVPPAGFLTPEGLAVIHDTILDVMLSDPRTGLLDFDNDGAIGASDLALWKAGDIRADANLDGTVDGNDFLAWQRNAEFAPPTSAIPEPSATLMLAVAWLALACGRVGRRAHAGIVLVDG